MKKKETDTKFENEIDAITQTNKRMGLEEFLLDRAQKQGERNRNIAIAEALLKEASFPVEKIADLVGVSVEFVNEIKHKMK